MSGCAASGPPLAHQPGERWLYHTGAEVLGVLIARASGQPLDAFLRERIFEPLGMRDTGFFVLANVLDRFGPCYWTDPTTGTNALYDPPQGQWSSPPAFPSGGAGLVSTLDDYFAFAQMLRAGGIYRGKRILSRPSVEAMTTDQLASAQRSVSGPDPSGALSWGFGVAVQVRRAGPTRSVGTYGWDGGLGTSWATDPSEDLIGILMTNQAWTSASPPLSAWTSGRVPRRPSTTEQAPPYGPPPVARGVPMSIRSEAVRIGGESRHGAGRSV